MQRHGAPLYCESKLSVKDEYIVTIESFNCAFLAHTTALQSGTDTSSALFRQNANASRLPLRRQVTVTNSRVRELWAKILGNGKLRIATSSVPSSVGTGAGSNRALPHRIDGGKACKYAQKDSTKS